MNLLNEEETGEELCVERVVMQMINKTPGKRGSDRIESFVGGGTTQCSFLTIIRATVLRSWYQMSTAYISICQFTPIAGDKKYNDLVRLAWAGLVTLVHHNITPPPIMRFATARR